MSASIIRERINEYLATNGISRTQFAKKTGLKQSTIQRQLSGDTALSAETIDAISLNYPINVSWLLLGNGPMNFDPIVSPDNIAIKAEAIANVEPQQTKPVESLSISDALAVIRSQQQIIEHQAEMLERLVHNKQNNNI